MRIARLIRKYILFLITIAFFFCALDIFPSGHDPGNQSSSFITPRDDILHGLESHISCIDVHDWHLTAKEIMDIFQELMETEPGLFFVQPKLSYAYDENGLVTDIYPQYHMDLEETDFARHRLIAYMENFTDTVQPDMSEGDKALLVHDHIAERYQYSPSGAENYDIYSLLNDGHGVCQAFSLMYIALGERIGLAVDLVTSETMDHAWNHVKVDGNYYHVDVTRDLSNESESYHHDRFLLCDIGMRNKGYVDFSCHENHSCNAHTYESSNGQTKHISLMCEITGGSVYIGTSWLSNLPSQGLATIVLLEDIPSGSRLTEGADLDGDGALTLSDLLLLQAHCQSEASHTILSLCRNLLLENAFS